MYDSYMSDVRIVAGTEVEVAVSDARERFAELIEQTNRSGEPVFLTRRGRRVAALIDADVLERIIERVEDTLDRDALNAAREDGDYIPWDEVKAELGLG